MNRSYLFATILLLPFLLSCSEGGNYTKIEGVPLNFSEFVYKDSCYSPLGEEAGMFKADFHISYVADEESSDSVASAINQAIKEYEFGAGFKTKSFLEAANGYLSEEKEMFCSLWDETSSLEDSFTTNYEYTKNSSFATGKGRVLCYESSDYVYQGGAHGLYGNWVLNFDCNTGRLLTMSDTFEPSMEAHVRQLIQQQLICDLTEHGVEGISTPQDLKAYGYIFEDNLFPMAKQFRLGPDGVTFSYVIYEVAPYMMGETFVTVPYDKIGYCLTDDAREVLGL